MDKESKENKKMPEDPVETPTGEDKIQDKAKEAVEEPKEETPTEPKQEEVVEETKDEPVDKKETTEEKPKAETKKSGKKEEKKEEPKEKAAKKADHDPDFNFIVRIANTDIDGDKNVIYGLTSIKGIGIHMANLIMKHTKIDPKIKMGKLSDAQVEELTNALGEIEEKAPIWMLNHRKDYDTGEDIHLVGPEIELSLRDEINMMKKIRCYRGIRHERNLRVRGQRTKANNRRGLTLGVSKKRD